MGKIRIEKGICKRLIYRFCKWYLMLVTGAYFLIYTPLVFLIYIVVEYDRHRSPWVESIWGALCDLEFWSLMGEAVFLLCLVYLVLTGPAYLLYFWLKRKN